MPAILAISCYSFLKIRPFLRGFHSSFVNTSNGRFRFLQLTTTPNLCSLRVLLFFFFAIEKRPKYCFRFLIQRKRRVPFIDRLFSKTTYKLDVSNTRYCRRNYATVLSTIRTIPIERSTRSRKVTFHNPADATIPYGTRNGEDVRNCIEPRKPSEISITRTANRTTGVADFIFNVFVSSRRLKIKSTRPRGGVGKNVECVVPKKKKNTV